MGSERPVQPRAFLHSCSANPLAAGLDPVFGKRLRANIPVRAEFSSAVIDDDKTPESFMERVFGPRSYIDYDGTANRWAVMLPAFATHMAIGSGWAWSVVGSTIVREHGFVCSAPNDWSLMEATMPMPIMFSCFGLTAAIAGTWMNKVGERLSLTCAAGAFGGGLLVGSAGIAAGNMPLIYLGYGAMAGIGVGLSYSPLVQTLMQWFPDKKGLAVGTLVAGRFGRVVASVPRSQCTQTQTHTHTSLTPTCAPLQASAPAHSSSSPPSTTCSPTSPRSRPSWVRQTRSRRSPRTTRCSRAWEASWFRWFRWETRLD
jgi:hypothetical protein